MPRARCSRRAKHAGRLRTSEERGNRARHELSLVHACASCAQRRHHVQSERGPGTKRRPRQHRRECSQQTQRRGRIRKARPAQRSTKRVAEAGSAGGDKASSECCRLIRCGVCAASRGSKCCRLTTLIVGAAGTERQCAGHKAVVGKQKRKGSCSRGVSAQSIEACCVLRESSRACEPGRACAVHRETRAQRGRSHRRNSRSDGALLFRVQQERERRCSGSSNPRVTASQQRSQRSRAPVAGHKA